MSIDFNFSKWVIWQARNELSSLNAPGVYALAKSKVDLNGTPFDWSHDIIYFGVSGALKKRLRQFDDTVAQRRKQHGGADRVLFKYPEYNSLISQLYVSVIAIGNTAASTTPDCLRRIGEAHRLEYYCMAKYLELHSQLPEFNRKDAPKFSRQQAKTPSSV
ncbi:MAG: hypothetical protein ACK4PK_09890 [Alphaproteobacteria bacterium]